MGGWFELPVRDEEGRLIPKIEAETGQPARDEKNRIKFVTKLEFTKPDARLPLRVLARINYAKWGKVKASTGRIRRPS